MKAEHVQVLSDADGIAAFFSLLGYNTNGRTIQAPGNLGITAESLVRRIRKVELIADDDGLFQVYLFQLPSLTIADARALAAAFRNRAGNFLLVLTANFDRLDFVLVEKYLPSSDDGRGIAPTQIKVRPRTLSVERRKPEPVQLRVLRRFTWTASDPLAQYEKLLAAYAVAYWSEDHFDNRALFSDYFLKQRLPNSEDFPEWAEDPKPAYKRLREIYQAAHARRAPATRKSLRAILLEPMFSELGFQLVETEQNSGDPSAPDYRLTSNGQTLALCLAYPWDRFLDGKDNIRDTETGNHNPGQRVVSLLERAEESWVVMTNGKLWRLYSSRAQSRASNYYEIDLDEALGQAAHPSGPSEGFRYFWLLFRRPAFEHAPWGPEAKPLSLLDRLFEGSQQYAAELGENLKQRVFDEIFPILAEGFVAGIREREGRGAEFTQERLDAIFRGVLTLLYRLLFLLYAEARDLLPVRETREYQDASLARIKSEVEAAAGLLLDATADRLRRHYSATGHVLCDRLAALFRVIDEGDPDLNVPSYNGGLFISRPRPDDDSAEMAAARFLAENRVADPFLARAIDLLARDEDRKTNQMAPIDFKSLGVRQLGSIYEGLLEFKLRIADQKKAIVKEKNRDIYVPFKELTEPQRERAASQGRVVPKGHAYLENDKGERKATGSYYTPDHIVSYIVEQAVGPVLREKFEAMRPKLREAEQWRRERVRTALAKGEKREKYETGPVVEREFRALVGELFNVKILDPAMGSGHFLVDAVDYITDKALDFLNAFPWNPVTVHLEGVRATILDQMDEQGIVIDRRRLTDVNLLKRHVLKRSIYGVDLNPMAVELAKVSLWLHCFTLGAPLSFLDHHIRCGNSLIGVSVEEARQAIERDEVGQSGRLFGSRFTRLMFATDLMRHVGELSDVTTAQVGESKSEYQRASDALAPFKRTLDIYTGQWFRKNEGKKTRRTAKEQLESAEVAFLAGPRADRVLNASGRQLPAVLDSLSREEREVVRNALKVTEERRFFHWELEFPEVFYGPRPGTQKTIERLENGGFDAVVGNPPYVRQEALKQDKDWYKQAFANTYDAANDLYVYFLEREIENVRPNGLVGLIVADKWLRSGYGRKLRKYLMQVARPVSIVDFGHSPIFPDADTFPCVPILRRKAGKAAEGTDGESNHTTLVCQFPREDYDAHKPIGPYVVANGARTPVSGFNESGWSLENPAVQDLLQKLRNSGEELSKIAGSPIYGVKTGLNEAFYIDDATRLRLIAEDQSSVELIRPLLRGRDIFRWRPVPSRMYVILSRRGIDIERYPAIQRHLQQFHRRLEPKPHSWKEKDGNWPGRAPGDYKWYELQASPSDEFVEAVERPKIVYQEIQFHSWFALDKSGAVPNNKVFFLPTNDPCLIAILNSPLMWWVLTRTLPHMKDEALSPAGFIMEQLRVRLPSGPMRTEIAAHVTALCRVTDDRHDEENLFLGKLATPSRGEADRRALNWLKWPDDDFTRLVERWSPAPISMAARRDLAELRNRSGSAIARLLAEQLRLEEELALLVEDVYELDDQERRLLRETRPVRDPLDVQKASLVGAGFQYLDDAREAPAE